MSAKSLFGEQTLRWRLRQFPMRGSGLLHSRTRRWRKWAV